MGLGGQRHTPAALPPGKTRYPLYRRLCGPRGRSGLVRKIRLPRGFDPRNVQPVASRYTDRAIPAQASIFSQSNSVHSLLPYAFKFHRTVAPLIPLLFLNKSLKLMCSHGHYACYISRPSYPHWFCYPAHTWERVNNFCTVTSTKNIILIIQIACPIQFHLYLLIWVSFVTSSRLRTTNPAVSFASWPAIVPRVAAL